MILRTGRVGLLALVGVLLGSLITALAATNIVPVTRAGHNLLSIGANDLKPADCSGITVTTVLSGSGTIIGSGASELVLGGSAADTITAGGGDDCILGGGGNDSIQGQSGTDVCIGGPGTDSFGILGLGGCEVEIQ
jgi:Ca2+-binding RTX toxin-like protein